MKKNATKKAAAKSKSAATKTKRQGQAPKATKGKTSVTAKKSKAAKGKKKAVAGGSSRPKGKTSVTAKKPKAAKGVVEKQKKATVAAAIRALLDERGLDGANFDDALAAARKARPDTKFSRAHYAWYRSKFKKAAATARGARR